MAMRSRNMTNDREAIVKRIDHVGVAVRDIGASLPYYVDVLGMKVSVDVRLADGSTRLAYLEAGDTTLQLVQPLGPGPVAHVLSTPGEGLHHVCFAVEDIVGALQSMPGGEPTDGIYIGGRQCRVSFIGARPNGLSLELTEMEPNVEVEGSQQPVAGRPTPTSGT
jgi:methylmalonyl-CoA/ethylmalonyl-CoA epimerase